jgi:hypothetical protein
MRIFTSIFVFMTLAFILAACGGGSSGVNGGVKFGRNS